MRRVRKLAHLARRFVGSLFTRAPRAADVDEVRARLTPAEFAVWERMPVADRAESLATLRRLPADVAAVDTWAAAALLHDAGKAACGLGTFGRTLATLRGWVGDPGRVGGAAGTYLRHAELGAEALQAAGARAEVVAWARTHHVPARWPVDLVPAAVCAALARADGEADDF